MENHGFFGMGLKKGLHYVFSVYARNHGKTSRFRVELVNSNNDPIVQDTIFVNSNGWEQYTTTLLSNTTDAKGFLRIVLLEGDGIDLDHVSLMPEDNWHGLRIDLVKDLEDLHPGIFRFPGGCIVEGTELETRYEWKNSIGPVENRPLNENRWSCTMQHRMYPNYFQSYGLGFYEFFLLSERIGAEPLPILSCGIACQFQNSDDDPKARVSLEDLQSYIDDALDLVEFANGTTTTKWGALRAEMGHPEPFNLKYIGIGNEQWGPLYPERLEPFVKAIRAKYPSIQIVGSSGPSSNGRRFGYGWEQMRRLKVDLVDEHYYKSPEWFLQNAGRYDSYDRRGPKVFAGEYAVHGKAWRNNFEAALAEAAFMTGLERNADIVRMATYAPLFAHVEGYQWRPDLIWFDNLTSVRTPNWYVQQLYSLNKGTHVLSLTSENRAVEGDNGLYASATYDKNLRSYIIKVVNTSNTNQQILLNFQGLRNLKKGSVTMLHADDSAENTIEHKYVILPQTAPVAILSDFAKHHSVTMTLPARTFAVYRFE